MSDGTGIEWTDATWNPVVGCTRVSAGCDHCYAVRQTHRLEAMGQERYAGLTVLNPRGDRHFNGTVRTVEEALTIPLRWKRPRRIFVNSMSDLFHKEVPMPFIAEVFAVMAATPQHTYQILTKRPERMASILGTSDETARAGFIALVAYKWGKLAEPEGEPAMIAGDIATRQWSDGKCWPLPNVWLGTSIENQATADERIPHLLRCPAAVRFLSCEPLLGPVDLSAWLKPCTTHFSFGPLYKHHNDEMPFPAISWVIVGGESGPGARPMHPDWVRSIRDQCVAAKVPLYVKQLTERGRKIPFASFPEDLQIREYP